MHQGISSIFLDDYLLFTEAKSSQVSLVVKEVLDTFCHASIKIHDLDSKNISNVKVEKYAFISHSQLTRQIGKYPINSRLGGWKTKVLSRVGRVTFDHCHWVNWETISLHKSHGGLRIRPARSINISLLGKHTWDMMHKKQKMGGSILQAPIIRGAFYTWNSIAKVTDHPKLGFQYRIGRGEISIWYNKWLTNDFSCHLVPYVNIEDTNLS
ncbi:hypothetical protein HKD37_07G020123 [Glycine soja]